MVRPGGDMEVPYGGGSAGATSRCCPPCWALAVLAGPARGSPGQQRCCQGACPLWGLSSDSWPAGHIHGPS